MRSSIRTVVARWSELIRPENLDELKQLLSLSVLQSLTREESEALLNLLPQLGALRGRAPGALRIRSAGYHIHLQGNDTHCPYPVDFFVRAGGFLSTVNLVLRLPACHVSDKLFTGMPIGSAFDLLNALRVLNGQGLGLMDLELVQQAIYRPCVPNKFHWSSPGGVRQPKEDEQEHGLRELAEEAPGLVVIASRVLLRQREYQAGNLPEFHTLTGVLCVGRPILSDAARSQGIKQYCFIPLPEAEDWFDAQCAMDLNDPACMLPGGKTEHALLKLFRVCQKAGIR